MEKENFYEVILSYTETTYKVITTEGESEEAVRKTITQDFEEAKKTHNFANLNIKSITLTDPDKKKTFH